MIVKELGFGAAQEYMRVPIAFEVRQRFVILDDGQFGVRSEDPPWLKDYDDYAGEGPIAYAARFDVSRWGVLAAFDDSAIVGGAILAFGSPDFDLLDHRDDMAHVVDIRVAPLARRNGIGRRLWEAAEAWSRQRGVTEIRVETQDINVPACRFYQANGCSLLSWSEEAYGQDVDEIQLIWGKKL